MPFKPQNIAIIGASGAIGRAFVRCVAAQYPRASVLAFSRQGTCPEGSPIANPRPNPNPSQNPKHYPIDYHDEASVAAAAELAAASQPLDLVLVAIGILHDADVMPEKSLKDLGAAHFERVFAANTIAPALIAKHFLPKLNREQPSRFAALSARVGSISDNRLGGWYAYRASKAALNMLMKNAAIEVARRNKHAVVVTLHPGTVDSALSQPFQANVPAAKLFTPDFAAQQLLQVLVGLSPEDSGKCFAWDGAEILP